MMAGPRTMCKRCKQENLTGLVERVRLLHGPNGERLCKEHHKEVWEEYMENHDD